jgi:hypothetical protein
VLLRRSLFSLLILILLLAACNLVRDRPASSAQTVKQLHVQDEGATDGPSAPGKPGPAASTTLAGIAGDTLSKCPITTPLDPPFTPPEPAPHSAPRDNFWYGSDSLWTALPQNGVWADLPHHPEGYTQKLIWGRKGYSWMEEPEPQLTVSGRRIDEHAPPLRADKASNAYAGDIGSVMMVGVDFPALGCWEITGRYAEAELSFVVWVGPTQVVPLSNQTSDLEALKLIAMGEQARQIAQKEGGDLVLRQVDTDLSITDFQFVDRALTRVITVIIPQPDAPVDAWYATVNYVSPLLSHSEPDLGLQYLKTGPGHVAQAVTAQWPGCMLRGMILSREKDQLTWLAFCNTPKGVVSGSMVDRTGVFWPSEAPPAPLPVTATPSP